MRSAAAYPGRFPQSLAALSYPSSDPGVVLLPVLVEELAHAGAELHLVVDGVSGTNLENTARIQTLGETADTLEGAYEPTVPDSLKEVEVSVTLVVKRRQSRGDRRDEACSYLAAVISMLEDSEEWSEHQDAVDLISELTDIQGEWENAEFPGMFG